MSVFGSNPTGSGGSSLVVKFTRLAVSRVPRTVREFLYIGCGLLACSPLLPTVAADDKQIYGWLEDVIVAPELDLKLTAKLDTGADTSTLDAQIIKRFRRKDERFVRFVVVDPETGESVTLVRPYSRRVLVKSANGEQERRVVVEMEICIGGERQLVEVSLTNRSQFNYPMLLGRSALLGSVLVDPELTHTMEPHCPEMAAAAEQ